MLDRIEPLNTSQFMKICWGRGWFANATKRTTQITIAPWDLRSRLLGPQLWSTPLKRHRRLGLLGTCAWKMPGAPTSSEHGDLTNKQGDFIWFDGICSWLMIAKLVNITPITTVYDTQITIVDNVHKPTNTTGGAHIVWILTLLYMTNYATVI